MALQQQFQVDDPSVGTAICNSAKQMWTSVPEERPSFQSVVAEVFGPLHEQWVGTDDFDDW